MQCFLCPALDYMLEDGPVVDPWNPRDISSLLQFSLEPTQDPYHPTTLNGVHYLASRETFGTYRAPRQGRCWLFDGINDFAVIASNPGTNGITTGFTFCAWLNVSSFVADARICERGVIGSANNFTIMFQGATGTIRATVDGQTLISTSAISVGTFAHVCYTTNGLQSTLYINGVAVGTASQAIDMTGGSGDIRFATSHLPSNFYSGRMYDARIYSTAKTLAQIQSIHAGDYDAPDESGLLAGYWCNEEAGTTGYDWSGNGRHLTLSGPITEATFHATDISITANPTNIRGGTLSGSTVIPIRPGATTDVLGGTPTWTGKAPYPVRVDTPCVTGGGYVNLGSALIPPTADFSISVVLRPGSETDAIIAQGTGAGTFDLYHNPTGSFVFYTNGSVRITLATVSGINARWCSVSLNRVGDLFTLTVLDIANGTTYTDSATAAVTLPTANTWLLNDTFSSQSNGLISDFRITTGGVTTTFALQEGPGSANDNRNVYFTKSDGTSGVVTNAIVGGTVSAIWANRVPGLVRDISILNGAGIAANGAVIPVNPVSGLCADGSTPTIEPGNVRANPWSRANENSFTAAEMNGLAVPTEYDSLPCVTGNGTNVNVNAGAAYVPPSADFTLGFWYRPSGTLSDRGPLTQGNNTSVASRFGLYHLAEDSLTLLVDHVSGVGSGSVTRPINKDVWSYVEIVRSGTSYTLTIAGSSASITNSGTINQGNTIIGLYGGAISGSVSELSITTGGTTKVFPLTDGSGSSIAMYEGDVETIIPNAIQGTLTNVWANRTQGNVNHSKHAMRAIVPRNTKFIAEDGDRIVTLKSAATGADLTSLLGYLE